MKGPKKIPPNISCEQLYLIACLRLDIKLIIFKEHSNNTCPYTLHSVETRVQGPENHLEDFSIFLFPSSIDIYPAEAHLCWERQRAALQQDKLQSTKFFHRSFHSGPSSQDNAVAIVDINRPDI